MSTNYNKMVNRSIKTKSFSFKSFFFRYGVDVAGILFLCLILTAIYPSGKSYQFADLKEGRVYIGPEIIAPFTFPINKSEEEYAADMKKARESVPPVFYYNTDIAENNQDELVGFIARLNRQLSMSDDVRTELETLFRENGVVLSQEDLALLLYGNGSAAGNNADSQKSIQDRIQRFEKIAGVITSVISKVYSVGILNVDKDRLAQTTKKLSISTPDEGAIEELENLEFYQDMAEARNTVLEKLRTHEELNEQEIKIGYQIAVHFIEPNVIYDKEEHEKRIDEATANVPLAKDQVLAGERIIDSHQRVTQQHIEKLNSLAVEKAERGEVGGFWLKGIPHVSKFFLTLAILCILLIYLWRDHREVISSRKKLLLIEIMILIIGLLTFMVNRLDISAYLIPVSIGAIIVTIFFQADVGLIFAITTSLLVGAMRGNEFGIVFISIFTSVFIILTVSKVRTRNWIVKSMIVAMGVYLIAITIHDLLVYIPFSEMAVNWLFGLSNGFLSIIFAYGLVFLFEFAFDLTTDMTLLELSDLNQPLLRQLAMRAPGTYHHSIMVGNLAEAAAESIGANALLARVGAYYHDIGKMEKPEYFVENQVRGRNPQEKLTPSMSSLILINHVRKGAEKARAHGLPKEIENFIYEHHGKSVMGYFYQKAQDQSEGELVSSNEYQYPGPRPQSRETAIVMLADAIEASSRTLKEPTPSRIKNVVEKIVDERFQGGELDDSPLTLKDLYKISESFQKILNGVFHARIDYSGTKESEKVSREEDKDQSDSD